MVLVTGGTGLIGSHLLFELLKNKQPVRAIYRSKKSLEKTEKVFSYYSEHPKQLMEKIDWVQADLLDTTQLNQSIKDVQYVYHCAALISFNPADYQELVKVNVKGTANIVNVCLVNRVKKLCYLSSIAALGTQTNGTPVTENTPWTDKNATVYGLTKRRAELEVWRGTQEGLPAVILNPGVVLGPGFWKSGSGSFFYFASKGNKKAPPGGTGFVSINDVVRGLIQAMGPGISKERFIFVSENLTYLEILQRIARRLGKPVPEKEYGKLAIEVFWRLDWVRSKLLNKRRRLAKQTAKSLFNRQYYSNKKATELLEFEFENLDTAIDFCCEKFKADFPEFF
ncbi:NAD-dependent epimerase/dehydratase family protein [Flagellimonas lutaonensis]|uniref:NAD-dependent epimerase/dehydratase n=1 Tax=Flagellimonas lutaonensis TaxID=516051 RepID=A0A0D5YS27_9FLAO|nr:NAD-dependent epimerase/dehydratase family protein [Allomuricauda lutaonensis]AKA34719.1 NAD-dependent epimerase/dehydratase [Allomuricauda lutaonensis]